MNTLYGLLPGGGLRQGSPWVMKVELAMRCLKIDYDLNQVGIMQVWTRAPEGKVPWLVIDGQTISGSERILGELEKYSDGAKFPVPEVCEDAQGILYYRLVEDHLFWLICAAKYLGPSKTANMMKAMMQTVPLFICKLISPIGEKMISNRIKVTSLSGLSQDEMKREARRDISILKDRLSSSAFIAGNGLSIYDFSVAAHIASILHWELEDWLSELLKETNVFYNYLDRVSEAVGGFEFRME